MTAASKIFFRDNFHEQVFNLTSNLNKRKEFHGNKKDKTLI